MTVTLSRWTIFSHARMAFSVLCKIPYFCWTRQRVRLSSPEPTGGLAAPSHRPPSQEGPQVVFIEIRSMKGDPLVSGAIMHNASLFLRAIHHLLT